MRYTGANNERFCKQWKGISFCPPPLIGLLAEVYPFPLVGEFPKPPAECWRNSDRTPQNCDGYASLIKEKPEAGHYATASGFPNTLTVLLLFLLLFLFFLFFLFNLKQAVHVGLDRLQFLVFLPQPFEILIGGFFFASRSVYSACSTLTVGSFSHPGHQTPASPLHAKADLFHGLP